MDELKDLKDLVKNLVKEDKKIGKSERIKILQEINTKLLTEYYIEVPGIKIEPLRVEAYYFHPKIFEDSTSFKEEQQKTFNRLFLHIKNKINFETSRKGGVDICLAYNPNDEKNPASYYLSFLIKNSRVKKLNEKEIYCKQKELNAILNQWAEDNNIDKEKIVGVLKRKEENEINHDQPVFHTVRVMDSIKDLDNKPFAKKCLASLIDINRKNENGKSVFDWANNFGKEWTVAEYMRCHPKEDRKAQCKTLIGYNSSKVLKILEEMEAKK